MNALKAYVCKCLWPDWGQEAEQDETIYNIKQCLKMSLEKSDSLMFQHSQIIFNVLCQV